MRGVRQGGWVWQTAFASKLTPTGWALAGISALCAEPVGVSLLTNARCQAWWMGLANRLREPAHFDMIGVGRDFSVMRRTCGSQLADECEVSGEVDGTGKPPSRASSLPQDRRSPGFQRY